MKLKTLLKPAAFLLLLCIVNNNIIAQTPPLIQWNKAFGGNDIDYLYSVQQTKDGGYILGGESWSGIGDDKTEPSKGSTDYWIVKIDSNGIKQWDKTFGGSFGDILASLQQTKDGGYILGGYSYSGISGDKTEPSRGSTDYWIVKVDANGIKEWDKTFGGSKSDQLNFVQQTKDNGYILGGFSYSDISGDKTQNNRGELSADYWIVKTDSNGIKQWDKRFGGEDEDFFYSLQQTADGGYILGGESRSGIGGDKTEANRGRITDYWLVKINGNGKKLWDKTFGGNDEDDLRSLQQTKDGGYILAGYSFSRISGDKTEANKGESDFWIIKTDANGVKQWDKTFGGSKDEVASSIKQTIDKGYIIGGVSYSGISGDKTEASRGGIDYWVVKTDNNGIKEWDKTLGGSDVDRLSSLQQTKDGGYVLGGYSRSPFSGDRTEIIRGSYDYWIVKLGCPPSAVISRNGSLDICQTGSLILNAEYNTAVVYQWYKDEVAVAGATGLNYTATTAGKYKYTVNYTSVPGCSSTSKIITVTNSCGKTVNNLTAYPNPSKGIITVTYKSETAGNVQLQLLDKSGRIVYSNTKYAAKGINTYKLNLPNHINGIYNLHLIKGNVQNNVSVIVQK